MNLLHGKAEMIIDNETMTSIVQKWWNTETFGPSCKVTALHKSSHGRWHIKLEVIPPKPKEER